MNKNILLILVFLPFILSGQMANLVPNSGFEKIIGSPEKWFYTGKDFDLVFEEWRSPTAASPDVYHEQIYVPNHWKERGFDHIKPFRGKSKIGITVFGCNQGKLHCREYVTTPLLDSLVIGQEYYLSMWVAPMTKGIQIDQIQVALDKKPNTAIDDRLLELKPYYNLDVKPIKDWQRIEIRFYAETEATFLTIGNFRNDSNTRISRLSSDPAPESFAYYYIDELTLFKIPPILPREEIDAYDTSALGSEEIILENIYFDFDEVNLLPESYKELNKLLKLMNQEPAMNIKITGHTDKIGSFDYNQKLSKKRAQAVADFLIRHYISTNRVVVKGVGFEQPIAPNTDESGRKLNRRVVFQIKK